MGALLALVGTGPGRHDVRVHADAASALANLVKLDDIKLRLLSAPNGLEHVFKLTLSPNVGVQRSSVKTLANLTTLDQSKEAIVNAGGVRCLFTLMACRDEQTRRRASRVLKQLSTSARNKSCMVDAAMLKQVTEPVLAAY